MQAIAALEQETQNKLETIEQEQHAQDAPSSSAAEKKERVVAEQQAAIAKINAEAAQRVAEIQKQLDQVHAK